MKSLLFLVSTPIGNPLDITLRALEILRSVDFIICEEYKEARRLLSHYKIEKELVALNEHNEEESASEIIPKMKDGKSAALISDCGTPLFSDPGHVLVQSCISSGIGIVPVPGANSLLPALIASGFKPDKFYYYGWLSPKSDIRRKEMLSLKNVREIIVLMETPYRLKNIAADAVKHFGEKIPVALAFELTLPTEKIYRGSAAEILKIVNEKNLKGEFVFIVDNRSGQDRRN